MKKWILVFCIMLGGVVYGADYDYSLSVRTPHLNLQLDMKKELLYCIPPINEYFFVGDVLSTIKGDEILEQIIFPFKHDYSHGRWIWDRKR